MSKTKRIWFNLTFIVIAFAITIGCVVTGAYIQQGYELNVGRPSGQRFKSPVTIENRIATEHNRLAALEAAERLDPITRRDFDEIDILNAHLDIFFNTADDYRRRHIEIYTPYTSVPEPEPFIDYETGERFEPAPPPVPEPTPAPKLPGLTESATETLLTMESERYAAFVSAVYTVADVILENGVFELDARTLLTVRNEMDRLDFNSDARNLGYDIITLHLRPNIYVDEEATTEQRAAVANRYERIYYLQGQTIVDEGQIVTEEAFAVLEELGLIHTGYVENIPQLAGAVIVILALFVITLFYLRFFTDHKPGPRETAVTFTLYVITIITARALIDMPIQLLPLTIFVILTAAFIGVRTALVLNLGAVIACFMIIGADIEFLIYYLLSGAIAALLAGKTTDRSRIFISALLISIVNMALFTGSALLVHNFYSTELLLDSAFAALAGMLSVIISFGSMPVWEAAYGLVTPIRLLDLTNPDSKLLRRLAIEAPGTYHHSVIVANLAETAAYDIGANTSAARAGGYYHDIGKLKYPQYFVENMVGSNPHDELEPLYSTQVIMSHVEHGRELAVTNKIPKMVQDIISQHHGTTLLKYFYHKAQEE
ncbi:MAG: HDIG domain-containing protein, partial [Defluviitaleaceae bacterium]|nr:HDIG domain-containing protein [Defluviitaleaceae bacterium]